MDLRGRSEVLILPPAVSKNCREFSGVLHAILDGNRRGAKRVGTGGETNYDEGKERLVEASLFALKNGVKRYVACVLTEKNLESRQQVAIDKLIRAFLLLKYKLLVDGTYSDANIDLGLTGHLGQLKGYENGARLKTLIEQTIEWNNRQRRSLLGRRPPDGLVEFAVVYDFKTLVGPNDAVLRTGVELAKEGRPVVRTSALELHGAPCVVTPTTWPGYSQGEQALHLKSIFNVKRGFDDMAYGEDFVRNFIDELALGADKCAFALPVFKNPKAWLERLDSNWLKAAGLSVVWQDRYYGVSPAKATKRLRLIPPLDQEESGEFSAMLLPGQEDFKENPAVVLPRELAVGEARILRAGVGPKCILESARALLQAIDRNPALEGASRDDEQFQLKHFEVVLDRASQLLEGGFEDLAECGIGVLRNDLAERLGMEDWQKSIVFDVYSSILVEPRYSINNAFTAAVEGIPFSSSQALEDAIRNILLQDLIFDHPGRSPGFLRGYLDYLMGRQTSLGSLLDDDLGVDPRSLENAKKSFDRMMGQYDLTRPFAGFWAERMRAVPECMYAERARRYESVSEYLERNAPSMGAGILVSTLAMDMEAKHIDPGISLDQLRELDLKMLHYARLLNDLCTYPDEEKQCIDKESAWTILLRINEGDRDKAHSALEEIVLQKAHELKSYVDTLPVHSLLVKAAKRAIYFGTEIYRRGGGFGYSKDESVSKEESKLEFVERICNNYDERFYLNILRA